MHAFRERLGVALAGFEEFNRRGKTDTRLLSSGISVRMQADRRGPQLKKTKSD
jgi:hypothetical protein